MSFNCCLPDYKSDNEVLVFQLKREVEKLMDDTTARLLMQDGKIAELCQYIKENLSGTIAELMDSMKLSGEISEIITDVVLSDIVDKIEKTNIFYNNVSTSKIYDSATSTYYYLTNIPCKDENGTHIQLKMGIANDDLTCSSLESTLKHAWRKNATLCINAGLYNVETIRPIASVIYNGEILYRDTPSETPEKYQYFAITIDNKYKVYDIGTTPEAMLLDGVWYAFPIFASLILNGAPVEQTDKRLEPRQSIGFKANGDIVIISCDGRNIESKGMSYDDLARLHANNGSINAYILDGGGSTSTVLRGVKQNENIDNFTTDRSVGTFLYVAKDTNVSEENNTGNDLGRVKQYLIGQIRALKNIYGGNIRLLANEGSYFPTIQFCADGEENTRCRFTFSYDPTNQRNNYAYIGLMGPDDTAMKTNLFRIFPQGVWSQTYHGPSSQRPNGVVGLCYFDETIGKPIWHNGTKWVDATGTAV